MTTIPSFSAKHWIDTNCRGGNALKLEAVDAISSFTLMWNIFEGVVCQGEAKMISVFKARAKEIAQRGPLPPDIEEGVLFWRQRYVTDTKVNGRFERLEVSAARLPRAR